MKKDISKNNLIKLDKLVSALDGIQNAVPAVFVRALNFKGRKSPYIAQKAIEALTDKTDLVFDPFFGSGAFIIASALAGRKIVGIELDNYTYAAVCTLLSKVDKMALQNAYVRVAEVSKEEVMNLYETTCCGVKNYISKLFFDPEDQEYYTPKPHREIKNGENIILINKCSVSGKRTKHFEKIDEDKITYCETLDTSAFPNVNYIENSRINITASTGANKYDRLFTKRNQKALILIQAAISTLPVSIERDVLEQALVSSLSLAKITMYGSSTDVLYHVIREKAQESNVWEIFEDKLNAILRFKDQYKSILSNNPKNNDRYTLVNSSYQNFCINNPNLTFDLIYTDFPYTDQVPYLERNQLYRIWLNTFYKEGTFELSAKMLTDEIVQTNAPSRPNKQKIATYYADIDKMFEHFGHMIKKQGLIVLTIKLGTRKYFTTLMEIINLARKHGFEYALRLGIDKDNPSLRKQSAYKNTLSNEMIVAFERLPENKRYWYVASKNFEFETVQTVYDLIKRSTGDVSLTSAVITVRDVLKKKHGFIANDSDLEIIRRIITENFEITNAIRIDSNKLYVDVEDNTDLFTKLYDYIPIIIRRLLDTKGKFVLDDLYFEIANALCNGNTKIIEQFLESETYQDDIKKLINNYCITTGRVYEKKDYGQRVAAEAVDISSLEGYDFEEIIKTLLEAMGYEDVIRSGGAGDLGVDLVAKKTENGATKKYLFQCKRWIADVGSAPMQRLDSERSRRGVDEAICITTAGYTKDGLQISQQRNIGAWDGEEIAQFLNLYFPGKFYNSLLLN